jgi:uncharacterized protein YecT (DUF1311 family)
MKICRLLGFILCILLIPAMRGQQPNRQRKVAASQMEMNQRAAGELKSAEKAMDSVYQQIRKQNADDKVFLDRLDAAQSAWAAFRDAELEAIFPSHPKQAEYGSVYPMCYATWKRKLTIERTRQLKLWVVGVKEGDVCAGSLPVETQSEE